MSKETDTEYNEYISKSLHLDMHLDFMNDRHDIKLAEEDIKKLGLEQDYFNILTEIAGRLKKIESWEMAQVVKPGARAISIAKLLRTRNFADE